MHKCDKCKCDFTSNQSLKYHIENKVCTKIKKIFLCSICPKSYKHKYGLSCHIINKHLNKTQKNKKKSLKCTEIIKGL